MYLPPHTHTHKHTHHTHTHTDRIPVQSSERTYTNKGLLEDAQPLLSPPPPRELTRLPSPQVIDCEDMRKAQAKSEADLIELIEDVSGFAGAVPEDKFIIVDGFQRSHHKVLFARASHDTTHTYMRT